MTSAIGSTGEDCDFCDVANGRDSAFVLYEDDSTVAFLARWPIRRGHTIVIPRVHLPDLLSDGAGEVVGAMAPALHSISRLLVEGLGAAGVNQFQNNGLAAGQHVFHLHVHLVPRRVGDSPLTIWEPDETEAGLVAETYRELERKPNP